MVRGLHQNGTVHDFAVKCIHLCCFSWKKRKQLSKTFFVFFSSLLCLFSRQLSETRCCFHWRPHSFHSHAHWLLVAMEKPRNGADNSSMREQRLEGLEGGSELLGPILSNHQAFFWCMKMERKRERFGKPKKWKQKMQKTNLLAVVKFVCGIFKKKDIYDD